MPATETVQLAVESATTTTRLIRVAGHLDRYGAARVAQVVDAQRALVVSGYCTFRHLVIDLAEVSVFELDALETLRHVPDGSDPPFIHVHVAGCTARLLMLPIRARQILSGFSSFPTAEAALRALAPAVVDDAHGQPDVH